MVSKACKSTIRALVVDDLISAAMAYNEALSCHVSLSVFDSRAEELCKARSKLLRWLRKL